MSEGILLFVEQRDGALNRTSLEALVAAQRIAAETGDKISAVVLGKGVSNVASEVASKKIDVIYTVEDQKIAEYTPDGYVGALRQVIGKLNPKLIIFSHTYRVRDFAPRLVAALGKTFVTDCVGLRVDSGNVDFHSAGVSRQDQHRRSCDRRRLPPSLHFKSARTGQTWLRSLILPPASRRLQSICPGSRFARSLKRSSRRQSRRWI